MEPSAAMNKVNTHVVCHIYILMYASFIMSCFPVFLFKKLIIFNVASRNLRLIKPQIKGKNWS